MVSDIQVADDVIKQLQKRRNELEEALEFAEEGAKLFVQKCRDGRA